MQRSNQGFTLIEVIIALFIFSLILTSSIKLINSTVIGKQAIYDKTLANWVAQNYIVKKNIDSTELTDNEKMGVIEWRVSTSSLGYIEDGSLLKTELAVYKEDDETNSVTRMSFYTSNFKQKN